MRNGVCYIASLSLITALFLGSCNNENNKADVIHFPLKGEHFDSSAPQPKLWLSDTLVELGEVKPDTAYVIPIVVKNIGNEELIIKRAFSDCGCVVSEVPQQPLKPGESDTLLIILNTKEVPFDATGRVVTVVTNTIPNNFKIRINFKISGVEDVVQSRQ